MSLLLFGLGVLAVVLACLPQLSKHDKSGGAK